MGQMIFVDEDEYNKNKYYAELTKDYSRMVEELREMMYPNINIWIDSGSTYMVDTVFVERAKEDFNKGFKWKRGNKCYRRLFLDEK